MLTHPAEDIPAVFLDPEDLQVQADLARMVQVAQALMAWGLVALADPAALDGQAVQHQIIQDKVTHLVKAQVFQETKVQTKDIREKNHRFHFQVANHNRQVDSRVAKDHLQDFQVDQVHKAVNLALEVDLQLEDILAVLQVRIH